MLAVRALVVLVVSMIAAAASAQELGRDYTRLTLPQTPGTAEKVEVLEFFSWGCSHCAEMHPLISEWEKQLPANAVVVKVPISLGHREWGQLVRAYYALEAMGELQRLDGAVFDAIHKEGSRSSRRIGSRSGSRRKASTSRSSAQNSTRPMSRPRRRGRSSLRATTASIRRRSWRSTANMSFAARRTPTRSRSRASSSTRRRRRRREAEEEDEEGMSTAQNVTNGNPDGVGAKRNEIIAGFFRLIVSTLLCALCVLCGYSCFL